MAVTDPTPDTPITRDDLAVLIEQAGAANVEALRLVTDTLAQFEVTLGQNTAEIARLREVVEGDPGGSPSPPWFGTIDGARGHDGMDTLLAQSIGATRPVGTFVRGYSGSDHPATFAASSVKTAEALGIGAMLNVKRDWAGLAAGAYDALIEGFYESWPVSVFGDVYINHEPENDAPLPPSEAQSPSNPNWVAWADVNAPIWCTGVRRYIDVAAPIIRARGLDVKIGGCLMGFSWDSTRWDWFKWWEGITPANLGEVVFSLDHYGKHRDTAPNPHAADIMPQVHDEFLPVMRAAGIGAMSFGEFNCDRRKYGTETVIGTAASQAVGLSFHAAEMTKIPECRMVCNFFTPGGPASGQAQLQGVAIESWADICMQGRRPT